MADKKSMSVSKAIETLNEIAAAKAKGTTKPDGDLSDDVKKAAEIIKKAQQIEADKVEKAKEAEKQAEIQKQAEALLKRSGSVRPRGGFSTDDLAKRGVDVYQALIQKRAGDDVFLKTLHEWNDDVLMASVVLGDTPENTIKRLPEFKDFIEDELGRQPSDLAKAMAAANSGFGSEWIPQLWSPDLVDLIRVERVVASMFRRFPMKQGTVNISTLVSEFTAFVIAESTGNTPFDVPAVVSDAGTGTVLLTAVELIVASIFSKTFEEDSIIPALPEIRRRVIEGMSKGVENALINGSTLATHPDADVTAGTDVAKAWNGLRFQTPAPPTTDLAGALMTTDNILSLKLKQGRFGAKDADSAFITSPQGLVKLLGLQDASGAQILMTLDRFGPKAVLLTGSVASLFGSDVVVSDQVKTSLDSTGIVPAMGTPTQTEIIRAHKNSFIIGDRRSLTVESDTQPLTRQRILVATLREIFQRVKPSQDVAKDFPVTRGINVDTL